jgi:hypothetical protein
MATFVENPSLGDPTDPDDQFVWGAEAIGKIINRNKQQTFRMLEQGLLPAKKVNRLWVSTRRQLRQVITGPA